MREVILVVDIGTSSMRLAALDLTGEFLWTNRRSYKPDYLAENRVEQDPETWLNSLDELMLQFSAESHLLDKVAALSITSQRSSVIAIDKEGKALRPALMWQDRRHDTICQRLAASNEQLHDIAGSRVNTAYSGPKMAWIKENEPEVYQRAFKFVTPFEFIAYRLTGQLKIDYSYASRSLLFDLKKYIWSEVLLKKLGIDREKLSDLVAPGSVIGDILAPWLERWDLNHSIPLISAGGDQQCSALGLGVINESTYSLTAGTGGYVMGVSEHFPKNAEGMIVNVSAMEEHYSLESTMLTCSSAFDYMCSLFFASQDLRAIDDRLGKALQVGKLDNLLLIPHFQGSGTPDWQVNSKARLSGLELGTSPEDIVLACLKGIACEFKCHVELMADAVGKMPEQILLAGGLVNSPVFTKLLSGLIDSRLKHVVKYESGLYGAWIAAFAELTGKSYEDAFNIIKGKMTINEVGQPVDRSDYDRLYVRYCDFKAATLEF